MIQVTMTDHDVVELAWARPGGDRMKNLNGDDGPEDEGGDQQKGAEKHGLAELFRGVLFPWSWLWMEGCHDVDGDAAGAARFVS